jgi:hypothetical protein
MELQSRMPTFLLALCLSQRLVISYLLFKASVTITVVLLQTLAPTTAAIHANYPSNYPKFSIRMTVFARF